MTKILNPKSEKSGSGPQGATETFSLISNEKLLAIYGAMVKCRMLEQRATTLFQQGRLTSDLHASAGREASAAAIGIDLEPPDTLLLAPGDWLPAFVKGMSAEGIFRALSPAGAQHEGAGVMDSAEKHILMSSQNGAHSEAALERAAETRTEKKGAIVSVFIGPGPDALKPWIKMLTSAAGNRLPIVFVHYADEPPAGGKTNTRMRKPKADIRGLPDITVDALDAVAVYRVAYEAIVRARQGRGATLIQCARIPGTPACSTRASEQSRDPSALRDPVTAMEAYLKRKAIEPEQHNRQVVESFMRDLDVATRFLDR